MSETRQGDPACLLHGEPPEIPSWPEVDEAPTRPMQGVSAQRAAELRQAPPSAGATAGPCGQAPLGGPPARVRGRRGGWRAGRHWWAPVGATFVAAGLVLAAFSYGSARAPETPRRPESHSPGQSGSLNPSQQQAPSEPATPTRTPAPAAEGPEQARSTLPIPTPAEVRAVSGPGRGDREASDALVAKAKDADGERALRLLREALEACPENPDAAVALTVRLFDRGQLEAAHTWAKHATELRPRRAAYQVLLGDVREARGRSRRARKAYERALELDPDHRLARRRLDRP